MTGFHGWPELSVAIGLALLLFVLGRDRDLRDGFLSALQNFSIRLRQTVYRMRMPPPDFALVPLFRWLTPLVFFFLGGMLLWKRGTPPLSPVFGISLLAVGAAAVADAALDRVAGSASSQSHFRTIRLVLLTAAVGCLAIGFLLRNPR